MVESKRIVWIDWLRVIACLMVMFVHSTEPFYLGGNGSLIESESDAWWVSFFDSFVRSCVPLFVIASSFLLLPLQYPAGTFFKKRAVRILIPFAVWSVFYAIYWGEPVSNLKDLLFNFNTVCGWQCEVAPKGNDTGGIYESYGRGWLYQIPDEKEEILKPTDWNTLRLRVEGTHVQTWLNGEPMTDLNDDLIGSVGGRLMLQMHDGNDIKVYWRNFNIVEL